MISFFINADETDHRPLVITIELRSRDRGPGYWKFNSNLLCDAEFQEGMRKELAKSISALEQKPALDRWEAIKERIRKFTKRYSRNKSNETDLVISQLNEIIIDMESRLPLLESEYVLLDQTKNDLTRLLDDKTKGIIFRSKTKWYSEGDRSTRYFFNLEKNRFNNRTCFQIRDNEGNLISDFEKILNIQKNFYSDLYARNNEVEFNLDENDIDRVTPTSECRNQQ